MATATKSNIALRSPQGAKFAVERFLVSMYWNGCGNYRRDTYVSLGGSNGCADQLTNWDGTQKLGLGA